MNFQTFGNKKASTLLLIPGLGVSYEIFLPLIRLTENKFRVIAAEVDGFTLGKQTRFTSVDDQATQVINYVKGHNNGHLDGAYGLSLGGKILSRILERNEIVIDHAILDAAPLFKEAFAARPQVKHLLTICPNAHVQIFPGMNHGQLLVDHPEEVVKRINDLLI